MSKPKGVSLDGDDFDELIRPLEQGLAIVYCAMDYACEAGDTHAPYLEPALSAAAALLAGLKSDMDKLREKTYNAAKD